jgi:methionine aminopeptidase
MERITVYPRNAKQKSLLKFLLEEMKVRFEIETKKDETLKNKDEVLYEWTVITGDKNSITGRRSLSAQFEHTIGVTADGCEIFTASNNRQELPIIKKIKPINK